jgi:hypothetical protein
MTTHETQPEGLNTTADETGRHNRPADVEAPMEPQAVPAEPMPGDERTETAQQPADTYQPPLETVGATDDLARQPDPTDSTDQMLFGDGELTQLRARWTEVQSAFVDDPRDCVQKADGLVADVVEELTASFAEARAHLEEQWARGEEVSTEDLRIALKRYREFFERLLAV